MAPILPLVLSVLTELHDVTLGQYLDTDTKAQVNSYSVISYKSQVCPMEHDPVIPTHSMWKEGKRYFASPQDVASASSSTSGAKPPNNTFVCCCKLIRASGHSSSLISMKSVA